MKTIVVKCRTCDSDVVKPLKEYTRSVKRGRKFYCNNTCSARDQIAAIQFPDVKKQCEHCGREFASRRLCGRYTRFCSRSCASAGSYEYSHLRHQAVLKMVEAGWGRDNLIAISETLKKREAWKYQRLSEALEEVNHEFEFPLGKWVFDLCIKDSKELVEFDGKDHSRAGQQKIDQEKESAARELGYTVERISVERNAVIDPNLLNCDKYARQCA